MVLRSYLYLATAIIFGVVTPGVVQSAELRVSKILPQLYDAVAIGKTQNLLILLNDPTFTPVASEPLSSRQKRFHAMKERVNTDMPSRFELLKYYSHLPMIFIRVRSPADIDAILQHHLVQYVYEDVPLHAHLTESLPLIRQSALNSQLVGTNTYSVAVLDTGVNYLNSAFGACTSPGSADCRVAASVDIAAADGQLDDSGHGTLVSGIIASTAKQATIVVADVFNGTSTSSSLVIAGINWAIANQALYQIAAMNISIGDNVNHASLCNSIATNPFRVPLQDAENVGIVAAISTGNNGFTNGINLPACTPEAISVGAVYDGNYGALTHASCTDGTSYADKVACFSNSASFQSMLAPGSVIIAAGYSASGTSMSAPFVAAAAAILRGAFPSYTTAQIKSRLLDYGVLVTDTRNSIIKPRLDLLASLGAANNDFTSAFSLTSDSGAVSLITVGATKETGEPSHANNIGGASVWWRYVPTQSGQVAMNTNGSNFDTLLGIYTGAVVGGLLTIASNDNSAAGRTDSAVTFNVVAGQEYWIAVDGYNGATGTAVLTWTLTQTADLSIAITSAYQYATQGEPIAFHITVRNFGPSSALNPTVSALFSLPVTVTSKPSYCTVASSTNLSCAFSTMAANDNNVFDLTITTAYAGTLTATFSVTSATSDGNSGNNQQALTHEFIASAAVDIPFMPPWALVFLGITLAAISARRKS